jgi:hypothetical protein
MQSDMEVRPWICSAAVIEEQNGWIINLQLLREQSGVGGGA